MVIAPPSKMIAGGEYSLRMPSTAIKDAAGNLFSLLDFVRSTAGQTYATNGGWGYTVNKNIGYGYVRNPEGVDNEYFISGTYELEVATVRHSCKLQLGPLYDPKMERVRQ